MHRLGTATVSEDSVVAETEIARVSAISGAVPVAVVSRPAVKVGVTLAGGLPCSSDPDLFFAESPGDVELAKSICGRCPARSACLGGALERREPWGVWGGQLFLRGEVVPRKRARGRPRKDDVAA